MPDRRKSWFHTMCRQVGLMVHHVRHPEGDDQTTLEKRELGRQVEEKQVDEQVTIRRTTIEEMEVRRSRGEGRAKD